MREDLLAREPEQARQHRQRADLAGAPRQRAPPLSPPAPSVAGGCGSLVRWRARPPSSAARSRRGEGGRRLKLDPAAPDRPASRRTPDNRASRPRRRGEVGGDAGLRARRGLRRGGPGACGRPFDPLRDSTPAGRRRGRERSMTLRSPSAIAPCTVASCRAPAAIKTAARRIAGRGSANRAVTSAAAGRHRRRDRHRARRAGRPVALGPPGNPPQPRRRRARSRRAGRPTPRAASAPPRRAATRAPSRPPPPVSAPRRQSCMETGPVSKTPPRASGAAASAAAPTAASAMGHRLSQPRRTEPFGHAPERCPVPALVGLHHLGERRSQLPRARTGPSRAPRALAERRPDGRKRGGRQRDQRYPRPASHYFRVIIPLA